MESVIETAANMYTPKMDVDTRLYSDQPVVDITHGIICPCTSKHIFYKKTSFQTHQKTKRHLNWIRFLNDNSMNYYQQVLEQEKTIKNQQLILADMDKQLQRKTTIIEYYENKYLSSCQYTDEKNLLDFD
tara:strand:- start:270 stop:659 length:390 start_codon:yes stop_codon:yes gene_type:complete